MIEKHERLNITLPKSLAYELTAVSKELDSKKSHVIAKALTLYFDELDTVIADLRYQKYLDGKSETYTIDEL